jgi:DnaJ-class molecular chaperone
MDLDSYGDEGTSPFAVLGVGVDVTTAEVRKKYRKLALTCHPDKFPNDDSKGLVFIKLTQAYEALVDEEQRAKLAARERARLRRQEELAHRPRHCGSRWRPASRVRAPRRPRQSSSSTGR